MFAQVHAGKVLFTGLLLLASLTIGLKEVRFEDRLERLWVVEGGRQRQPLWGQGHCPKK